MLLFARHSRCSAFMPCLMVMGLMGCANVADLPNAPEDVSPIAALAPSLPPYLIQVGDTLEVKMALNPEFDQELLVRPDGLISTALAQDIPAYGKTPKEVQEELMTVYRKQLSNPQLTVSVKTFTPTRVYVMGEVTSPGEFISVGPNPTLLQAIARAGGVRMTAATNKIVILRRGAADKAQEVYGANLDDAVSGRNPSADVRLAAYDVVFVPRTGVAEGYKIFNQHVQQFLPTSFGMSYNLNPSNDN